MAKKSPAPTKVDTAVYAVQDAVAKALEGLSSQDEKDEFMERLLFVARGWGIALSEQEPDGPK